MKRKNKEKDFEDVTRKTGDYCNKHKIVFSKIYQSCPLCRALNKKAGKSSIVPKKKKVRSKNGTVTVGVDFGFGGI